MDVVCGRCRAEYEFDDALISERGTTVRCTNCGLQFKVFPPVGLRAPEVWLVFDPRDRRVEPIRYDSLRAMQKDIARGAVTADHLLARGDEAPRPLRNILELQPLLQQPKSERPPPAEDAPAHAPPPPGMKTVLGVAQRPDPAVLSGASSPPRPPQELSSDVDEHAVVPAQPSDPRIPVSPVKSREAKPRIRSALSTPQTTQSTSTSAPDNNRSDVDEAEGQASIPPPRQSLRATLVSSSTPQRPSPVPGEAGPASKDAEPLSERGPVSPPMVVEKTPVPENEPSSSRLAVVDQPIELMISDSTEIRGQMTPTPLGMRSYGSPEADPVSSMAGVHVKQSARTGGIVLAVLLGGAAFLGFVNREKLSEALSGARPENAEPEMSLTEFPSDLADRLQMVDAAWITAFLLKNPGSELLAPTEGQLQKLQSELSALGVTNSWERVNLLRIAGRLTDARASAGSLDKSPEQSYALALLDLAEERDNPPWPVVIERLREASSGERGRFLARSVYIYSLAASGALARARADFEALSQIAAAKEAPLYERLRAYLERLGAFEGTADTATTDAVPADAPPTSLQAAEGDASEEKAAEQGADAQKTAGKGPHTPAVPDSVKRQVDQADALWRSGNQAGAVVIYRQVVAQIGTTHFLGQRSASRIAQAERERATEK